jgi:tetratricopeptide (TPR) repeat protein
MKHLSIALVLACVAVYGAAAQTKPGTNPGTVPDTSTTPNSRTPTTPNSRDNSNNTSFPDPTLNMPIFITGKIVMADGSPVPYNVPIKRICANEQRTVAYTDSKGHFSIQSGQNQSILPDASDSSYEPLGRGSRNITGFPGNNGNNVNSMLGCELRADVAGFSSDSVHLDNRRALDDPDVGNIVLRRLANVAGTSVSATSFNAPNDAKKAYEKGVQLLHKNKPADAEKELTKAVGIYPKYANAWLELGRAKMKQQSVPPALEAFHKALEADGKLVEADVELGMSAVRDSNWADAAKYLDEAIRLDPVDFPQIWFADAVANFNLKNYDSAEKTLRSVLKMDTQHKTPQADQLLGLVLATKRDYSGAVEELQTYIRLAPQAPDLDRVKSQLVEIQNLQANSSK